MRLVRHLALMSIAVGLSVGPALIAHAQQQQQGPTEPPRAHEPNDHERAFPANDQERPGEDLLLNGQLTQANEWIGKPILDQQGQQVGELEDLAIDVTNGRVAFGIVNFDVDQDAEQQNELWGNENDQDTEQQNDLWGNDNDQDRQREERKDLSEGLHAIPWEAFEPALEEEALRLTIDLQQVDPQHAFEEGDWPDMTDEQWARRTHEQYGVQIYWEEQDEAMERPERREMEREEPRDEEQPLFGDEPRDEEQPLVEDEPRDEEQPLVEDEPRIGEEEVAHRDERPEYIESLDEMIGRDVNDPADESLAEVEDLVIDLREGRVPYAVLSYGGILGIGQDHVLVPWQALEFDAEQETFVLDATEEQLDQFAFDPGDWPEMTDEQWASQVHTEFGQEPYWEVYGYAAPGEEEPEEMIEQEIEEPAETGVQELEQSLQQHMEQAGVPAEQARNEAQRLAQQFQRERPDEQAITQQIEQALERAGVDPDQAQETAREAAEEVSQQIEELDQEPTMPDPFEPAQPEQPDERERPGQTY